MKICDEPVLSFGKATYCIITAKFKIFYVRTRGGVLEDTFWCPWPQRSSPWPRNLKSSKIALSSARSRIAVFFELLKFCRSPEKNFWRPLFFGDRLKKNFEDLFLWEHLKKILKVVFFENTCACVLDLKHSCPWPREGLSSERLSLALDFFVSLALSLVSSTPPLVRTSRFWVNADGS